MNNNIIVDGKEVDLSLRGIEVLTLTTLEEYVQKTGLSREELVKFTQAEITMLDSARKKYITVYRDLVYLDPRTNTLGNLLAYIEKRIASKTRKLNKYKGLA